MVDVVRVTCTRCHNDYPKAWVGENGVCRECTVKFQKQERTRQPWVPITSEASIPANIPYPDLVRGGLPRELSDQQASTLPEQATNGIVKVKERCFKCGTEFDSNSVDTDHLPRDPNNNIICYECVKTFCQYCGHQGDELIPVPGTFYMKHKTCGTYDPTRRPNLL